MSPRRPEAPPSSGATASTTSITPTTPPGDAADALSVAVVVGPHGVRGWVRVHLHAPGSKALRPGLVATLRASQAGGDDLKTKISSVDPVPGKPLLRVHFAGIDDRDRAEALRGREVWLARADLPALKPDEFYLADLIGLSVERLRPEGRIQPLGTVVGLTSNGAQDLLEVEYEPPGRRRDTWLLPVLPQFIVEIEGRLRVDLPLGMLPDALADGDEHDDDEPGEPVDERDGDAEPAA